MEIGDMEQLIIIVSCDVQFRDALARLCADTGRRIEAVDSITTALEIAVRRPVCVVVVDASRQVLGDAMGLAKAIHEQNPDVKCFLIVDERTSDVSNSTDNEPWLRFVQKPISMLQFAVDVGEALRKSTGVSLPLEKGHPRPQTNRLL